MGSCLLVPDVLSAGADNIADTTPGLASWSMMAIGLLRGGRDYGKPSVWKVSPSHNVLLIYGENALSIVRSCSWMDTSHIGVKNTYDHLRCSAMIWVVNGVSTN